VREKPLSWPDIEVYFVGGTLINEDNPDYDQSRPGVESGTCWNATQLATVFDRSV